MDGAPAVNCPVHGTHGALSNGKCWYCVQSGQVSVSSTPTGIKRKLSSSTQAKVGTKRKIA